MIATRLNGLSRTGKLCLRLAMALALIGMWGMRSAMTQTLTLRPIKDFKVPDYYPNVTRGGTNQLRTLLTGVEARPRPDGRVFVKEARILHFSQAGQTQLVVRAADCIYDYKSKSASSTNALQFQTGDGRFYLEGMGFRWDQTNSNLAISNKVHTLLGGSLVESSGAKSSKPAGAESKVEISSDAFEFISESKLTIWRGNVRVKDPRLIMTSELLTAKLASDEGNAEHQGGKLESVVAETNVAIMITESNSVTIAKGEKAIYSAHNETLVLSGKNPMLESESSHLQMWSPHITMDLTNKTLNAKAPVRIRIPPGTFGKMAEGGLSPRPGTPQPAAVQENIEISSDDFEFGAESKVAIWRRNVRAKDLRLNLTCELLTAKLAGEGGKPESIVAETNVVMTITETNGVTTARSDKAVYSAQNETLVLSGTNPMLELKSASSHLQMWSPDITLDLTNKTLKARAPVRTRIPSGAFGKMSEVGANPKPSGLKPMSIEQSAEVLADNFEFNTESKLAIWRGNVHARDPRSNIICEFLTAKLAGDGGGVASIVAEMNVVMRITETNGVTTARGDKAVYSAATEMLVLSGKAAVVESESSHLQMWSRSITYDLKNGKLNAQPPVRGSILPSAFNKIGEGDSSLKPAGPKK